MALVSKPLAPDVFDSEVGRTAGRFCPRFPHRCPILPHSGIFELAPFGEAHGQENTLRLRTDIVTLSVSVSDRRNNFVPGLCPQDYEVYEDG
jgi:hypothetical protein